MCSVDTAYYHFEALFENDESRTHGVLLDKSALYMYTSGSLYITSNYQKII